MSISLLKALRLASEIRLPKAVSHLPQQGLDQAHHFVRTEDGLIFTSTNSCANGALEASNTLGGERF
jgi:hypothetical protein